MLKEEIISILARSPLSMTSPHTNTVYIQLQIGHSSYKEPRKFAFLQALFKPLYQISEEKHVTLILLFEQTLGAGMS
jgi:hypothetical protein